MEEAMGEPGDGQGSAQGGASGDGEPGGSGSGGAYGQGDPGGGNYGGSQPAGGGTGGPLTRAEQVAILDGQLEKGTGEFDSMILEEQASQRRAAREKAATEPSAGSAGSSGGGASGGSGSPYEGGMADAGGYSGGGGGIGGASGGGGQVPENTAKYPPPADIPNGSDDDVVARQLREAAMREPDPAIREKLWDEYRKYKGISE